MAEQLLEKQVCQTCSEDVRQGALFCYNCGSQVARHLNVENEDSDQNGQNDFRLDKESATEINVIPSAKYVDTADKPIEKPQENPFAGLADKIEIKDERLAAEKQPGLKTAASLRKKNRAAEKKPVEIVWEPPRNSANVWFIIASIVFLLVAVFILMAMLYIR